MAAIADAFSRRIYEAITEISVAKQKEFR